MPIFWDIIVWRKHMKDEGSHLCSYREEHNICVFMESSLKINYTAHNAIANA